MKDDLDFCVDCMEPFRYDDCGGYNPPCECGAHCRDCHDAAQEREDATWEDDYPDPLDDVDANTRGDIA